MLFLVRTDFIPPELPEAELADLLDRERLVSAQLQRDDIIVRLWRVPGTRSSVGMWRAADETELEKRIGMLPCAEHMSIVTTPIIPHPNSVRSACADEFEKEEA